MSRKNDPLTGFFVVTESFYGRIMLCFSHSARVSSITYLFFLYYYSPFGKRLFSDIQKNTVLQVFIFDSRQHFYERLGGNKQEKCGGKGVDDVEREAGRI